MKTKLRLIITLFFIGITLVSKAQSTLTLNNINQVYPNLRSNSLDTLESEKWSNKIKPFYTEMTKRAKSITIDKTDSTADLNQSIDEKMCLLIKKNFFVDTDFRMPKSSENIDLKMVYPRRNFNK